MDSGVEEVPLGGVVAKVPPPLPTLLPQVWLPGATVLLVYLVTLGRWSGPT